MRTRRRAGRAAVAAALAILVAASCSDDDSDGSIPRQPTSAAPTSPTSDRDPETGERIPIVVDETEDIFAGPFHGSVQLPADGVVSRVGDLVRVDGETETITHYIVAPISKEAVRVVSADNDRPADADPPGLPLGLELPDTLDEGTYEIRFAVDFSDGRQGIAVFTFMV